MHILVVMDSFKGTLTSRQAGEAVALGLRSVLPESSIHVIPVSDGGDGLIEAFHASLGGRLVAVPCRDPLGRPVAASHLQLPDGASWDCVVEMASSSGLVLLEPRELDVMRGATWGVGEQIRAVLDAGARSLLVGAGGSATCDGGAGMLQALGMRLLDRQGRAVKAGGAHLMRIASLDGRGFDARLSSTRILVASDVDNPFVGSQGAAHTFAPQKGATPSQVQTLERGMASFARVLEREMGLEVTEMAGAGAAGGLAGALMACCGAQMAPGFDVVSEALSLPARIRLADLVITGEGSMDSQTLRGKLPLGVARLCRESETPLVSYCGRLRDPDGTLTSRHFARVWDLETVAGSAEQAVRGGGRLLEEVARSTAGEIAGLVSG